MKMEDLLHCLKKKLVMVSVVVVFGDGCVLLNIGEMGQTYASS
jgi:hypothetical protein